LIIKEIELTNFTTMEIILKGIVNFFHWLAWLLSILASVFFFVFILGEGAIQDMLAGKAKELTTFIPWLLIAMGGCVLSLFRKAPGGLLMLAGGIAMVLNFYMRTGWLEVWMMVIYGFPYIIAGLVFLIFRK
jgi:hypothetical protein